ncbi:MAG: NUDIX domain-containing protein [Candidatus Thiodiazotropha taylori]|nr:NUDIX domain-containing protein [Candidatus Thiodiazotropha taylori]
MKRFNFCPHCGSEGLEWREGKQWFCNQCGFTYFHNAAAAVGAVLSFQDQILLTVRKHYPCQGMLDLPGGFVDYHESLEAALSREISEELNLLFSESRWRYLFSYGNRYLYADIQYYTTDAFFLLRLEEKPEIVVGDDVAETRWIKTDQIALEDIGLESVRNAVGRFIQTDS